jgi:hypothetical protein
MQSVMQRVRQGPVLEERVERLTWLDRVPGGGVKPAT